MKNMKRITGITLLTILLVFITAFCISGTVHSRDKARSIAEEEYYHTAGQEYMQAVRNFLEEKGYGDSGVTINYVISGEGSLEYTVTIHHRKIDKLDEEGRNLLAKECRDLTFPSDPFSFSIVFL